jgi:hypothetical protein
MSKSADGAPAAEVQQAQARECEQDQEEYIGVIVANII